jgi:6-phosphogluconate dehydrogenase
MLFRLTIQFPRPPDPQNLALNVAEKGFKISVYNRSGDKTDNAVARAQKEGLGENLVGFKEMGEFVQSLAKPRCVIILVKAGAPVDATIEGLSQHMEPGDIIIDGGNEWYENTERRAKALEEKGLLYLGMGVSGGEEGARNGPSMMPGGSKAAYDVIEPIITKVCAQTDSGPCTTYVGPGGAGNFVKMVHNGIEYGDMQLISEAYDVLKTVGGLTNAELAAAFNEWNAAELDSFLIEISALILAKEDDQKPGDGFLVDKILDKTGMKGTGKWTVQQAAELSVAIPTVASSLDARFISGVKDERVAAQATYAAAGLEPADAKASTMTRGGEAAARRRRPRRALRLQDLLLRAGHEPDPRQVDGARVGPGPRRDGQDLEGRLHHPRALPRPHQAGVRQGRRPAVPPRRRRIRQGARGAQRLVEERGDQRDQRGRRHPFHVLVPGVL